MPPDDAVKLTKATVDPAEKWRLVAPWWKRMRLTGYGQCITRTVQALAGVEDLNDNTWEQVQAALAARRKPGYTLKILRDVAHLDHIQVNSLWDFPFEETQHPNFILEDISFLHLTVNPPVKALEEKSGIAIGSLDDFERVIDWTFDTYGSRAVAIKSQAAYLRRLDYEAVAKADAARAFGHYLRDPVHCKAEENKVFEDYLFHTCLERARAHRLPVKLHTGYYAGTGTMPLHRVGSNPGDVCPLLQRYPDLTFVLMHTMYPYQDEAIAIAKQHPNAVIDMCWSWIVAPMASRRFLLEMLTTAPVTKVLPFGGDFMMVESIVGHAAMARDGIADVLASLVEQGLVREGDVVDLATTLMTGNARRHFPAVSRLTGR
jgi:hypothetical protein